MKRSIGILLLALSSAAAQQAPRAHPLAATTAVSADLFGSVASVRSLPGGRLLVNDNRARRLLLLDSTLATVSVVLDAAGPAGQSYGRLPSGIVPFRGDSTLFVDRQNSSMLAIDPAGRIARVLALPHPADADGLVGGTNGAPGFDALGRLIYRGRPPRAPRPGTLAAPLAPSADSAPLLRIDLVTRKVDTVGRVRLPRMAWSSTTDANGLGFTQSIINPLLLVDDWAVLADGSVAIVRGVDYHIDWINPEGTSTASGKLPFEWRRLSDDDKARFIDSTRAALERLRTEETAKDSLRGPLAPLNYLQAAGVQADALYTCDPKAKGGCFPSSTPPLVFVQPSELPDYPPPFPVGAAHADADGNLWIRTTLGVAGGPIYDVVSRGGQLIDRAYVPPGRVIVGFGAGGVVYMAVKDGERTRLERARLR